LFNYARHFGLLGLLMAALAIAGPRAGSGGIGAQFALYGALHAAALALSLVRGARLSAGRRLLFVAVAAILSLSTARLGFVGFHVLGGRGGSAGLLVILAACAGLGALAYGFLIRGVLMNRGDIGGRLSAGPLTARSLGAISLGCAAAASACFAAGRGLHAAGVLWLAGSWWFTFSCGLWLAGRLRGRKMPH
jgi:hypothetical protein